MRLFLVLLAVVWNLSAFAAQERQIQCRVVGISDGDTLTCLQDRTPLKVRLLHIDAPESAQPFGQKAKQALSQLAFKKQVTLQSTGYDRYQRLLAVVFDGNRNLNLALVQQGMAWTYSQTQPIYEQAMAQAKQQRIGLWQDTNPINPYDWRKVHSHTNNSAQTSNSQKNSANRPLAGALDCSKRLSCQKIGNYALAQCYYQQCGWKFLDGNNDGIVCNKLYRQAQKQKEQR